MKEIYKTAFQVVVAFCLLTGPVRGQLLTDVATDPDSAAFYYTDVQNFVGLLDLLEKGGDTIEIIQTNYFDKASPGLKEFINEKDASVEKFALSLSKRPDEYQSLRKLESELKKIEPVIRQEFVKLKALIPDAVYLPTYFMVGHYSGAMGEPSGYGLMIAFGELDEDISQIPDLVVHETVHVQQALTVGIEEYLSIYGEKKSLLAITIREGVATYLTELITGNRSKNKAYDYLIDNEERLWLEFTDEMDGPETGDWMWVKPRDPDQPRDIGYVLGARIVESYYTNATDKKQAILDILSITDYKDFLEKSRYGEQLGE